MIQSLNLQGLGKEIQLGYLRAEQCTRQAEIVRDARLRADYLWYEWRWLKMARSCGLGQRLTLFINEKPKHKNRSTRPAAEMVRVKPPEAGKGGTHAKCLRNQLVGIVDDDECARSGLRALIESLGYSAAEFASAKEYLASDMCEKAACLILDVYMPGMTGPDLQAHLIAGGSCPPIVFATGRFEEHVRKRVIEAGALGYLRKPCDEDALLECIGKITRTTA